MTDLHGSVERVVFHNQESGFLVARFRLAKREAREPDVITIVGAMPTVRTGEMLRIIGEWQLHPVHGRNFRVEHFEPELPSTEDGIERYLASGAIRGIGPITARRIVERFGDRTIEVIDQEPALLQDVGGISAKRLKVITAAWAEQKKVRELMMFLQSQEISVALASRIYQAYGDEAVDVIKHDPYRLAHDIHGIGFRTADTIARQLGMSKRSVSRYVAGLKYVLSQATERGHVFLPLREHLEQASRLLEAPTEELEPALLELLRRGDAVVEGDHVYLAPFYIAEQRSSQLLEVIHTTPSTLTLHPRFNPAQVARKAGEAQGLVLAERQLAAVELALGEKVSILTGGPGTGKTSTLRTIITALVDEDISFCLCAPTGRAAKRVAETTGHPASTIHRLLEFQPSTGLFNYDQSCPLPYDFVIVDEVSMLDILLFYHLLKAIPPESHLLLVGDADQLPAVGPGNVLRDLINSGTIQTVTLTELFRQARGSQIVLAAHAVNRGEPPELDNAPDGDLFFVRAEDDDQVVSAIKRLLAERIPARYGLDPIDDVQVITPMHNGRAGIIALNADLQRLLNPPAAGKAELVRGGRTFRVGDKVMQVRNDYDKDVYNGDVGRIVAIQLEDQRCTIAFSGPAKSNDVEYAGPDLDELVHAYAVSVHKAQGSEFPCVVMPLVTGHYVLLQRNLLYTAITRARQLCVLVGSPRALSLAVNTYHGDRRYTALAERLKTPVEDMLQLELA